MLNLEQYILFILVKTFCILHFSHAAPNIGWYQYCRQTKNIKTTQKRKFNRFFWENDIF
uniref:Uncharacterized protein n=1 Tax=Anguilla anguilla TaxID=7936 RepID=A0A0E9XKP1_ANGAN